jgi:hypothetical protein
VIEDIEGAAPEPTRRGHVVALSAAVATASLVLLLTLVVPAPRLPARADVSQYATSPAPSASTAPVAMFAPNTISRMRVDLSRTTLCSDGARIGPPYSISLDGASPGRVFIVYFDDRTGEQTRAPVPAAFRFDARTGWMTVTCATDELLPQ